MAERFVRKDGREVYEGGWRIGLWSRMAERCVREDGKEVCEVDIFGRMAEMIVREGWPRGDGREVLKGGTKRSLGWDGICRHRGICKG